MLKEFSKLVPHMEFHVPYLFHAMNNIPIPCLDFNAWKRLQVATLVLANLSWQVNIAAGQE